MTSPVGQARTSPAGQVGLWRGTVAVAAVSAVVAALVSVVTTLVVVRVDDRRSAQAAGGGSGATAASVRSGLPALVAGVASGVVRIETTACTEGSVGSGFLVSPELVATVAHVVAGAHKIVITAGADSVPGTVVGIDPASEVALIRADRPFNGHVFTLAAQPPQIGSEVVGLGYPLGGGLSLVHGIVSALDRSMRVDRATAGAAADSGSTDSPPGSASGGSPGTITQLLQVDGLFTGGDSGGPLVAASGSVVGLVEARASQAQGIGFAVNAQTARAAFDRWRTHPHPLQVQGDCAAPVGPPEAVAQVDDVSGSADGPAVQALLGRFATALNAGRYAEAFALFTPAARRRTTLQEWTAAERSSRMFDIVVHQVVPLNPKPVLGGGGAASGASGGVGRSTTAGPASTTAGRALQAQISFTSVQDAAFGTNGQLCSLWQLTYLLAWAEGRWRIERASPLQGSPQAC
jgi:S1-C subfamily serine protease